MCRVMCDRVACVLGVMFCILVFFFKQKTAYEMRISDWSSDVCSSDLKTAAGNVIKVADLVDDDAAKRDRVAAALKSPNARDDRDFVDIIIALGMAKEGFDWIWCEHALTVGYRSSLTEIIQIIGRATRDARSEEQTSELQSLMPIP